MAEDAGTELEPHNQREGWPMSGRRELPNQRQGSGLFTNNKPNTCLEKLKPNEPYFVLRGQDFFAPALIRMWADLNTLNPYCSPEKIRTAREIALQMDHWPDRKWPD